MENTKRTENYIIYIISVIFCLDFVSYFIQFASIAVMKVSLLLTVFLSIFLIRKKERLKKHNSVSYLLNFYIILLSLRLCVDLIYKDLKFPLFKSNETVFFLYFFTIVLPVFFFYLYRIKIPVLKLARVIGTVVCLGLSWSVFRIFTGQVDVAVTAHGGFAASEGIDIIYFGHLGVSLAIIGGFLFTKSDLKWRLISVFFVLIGVISIALSGERGPFVAFVACVLIYVIIRKELTTLRTFKFLIIFLLTYLSLPFLISFLNDLLLANNIYSLSKINMFINGGISETGDSRMFLYEEGIQSILDNPILGYSYLMKSGGYVHNLFLESFMATGCIGGFIFLLVNFKILKLGYNLCKKKSDYILFYLLFIQYLIFGSFSRTAIVLPMYWLMIALIISSNEYYGTRSNNISSNTHV